MSLRELVSAWFQETLLPFEFLANQLLGAALAGDFDQIKLADGSTQGGLIHINPNTGRFRYETGAWFMDAIELAERKHSGGGRKMREFLVRDHIIGLRREAVWDFCRSRKFAPPTFWPFPPETRGKRVMVTAARRLEIIAYLRSFPPKSRSTEEFERAAVTKFRIGRDAARKIVAQLPAEYRLERGEKKPKSLRKSAG